MGPAPAQDGLSAVLAPLAAAADDALAALAAFAPSGAFAGLSGARLLGERTALTGRPGDTCRLLEAADGWLALNLARPDDWELLPAWLEGTGTFDWKRVARDVRGRAVAELVERGRLLGLAVAADQASQPAPWYRSSSPRRTPGPSAFKTLDAGLRRHDGVSPLVLDLSSLWAGPLCGHLLQRLGADVVKVESTQRPDGARRGPSTFFDLLNAGKASVALDLQSQAGRGALRALLACADIVIEASRPRALRQMGIVAEDLVAAHGLTWVSITGYGRGAPHEDWVAYGDDAAVAAGLSHVAFQTTGRRTIVGDAVADPLTGLHAALAAWSAHRAGSGQLIALALCDVVRHCLTQKRGQNDFSGAKIRSDPIFPVRRARGVARPLGADTAAVLGRFGIAA